MYMKLGATLFLTAIGVSEISVVAAYALHSVTIAIAIAIAIAKYRTGRNL